MPDYGPPRTPLVFQPGVRTLMWKNEVPGASGADSASIAVLLNRAHAAALAVSIELTFAADPGAFQIDLETSDTNGESWFVTKASLTTGLNAQFAGRIEATNIVANYLRLKKVTLTNPVAVTATIS